MSIKSEIIIARNNLLKELLKAPSVRIFYLYLEILAEYEKLLKE